jgi:hypothetical protein
MLGAKTGGRTAGTPNRRTTDLMERLEALGCDPLEGLARIAADPTTDTTLRARVFADLLPYLYPKRKALEMTGADGGAVEIDLAGVKELLAERVMRKLLPERFATDGATGTGGPAGAKR